MEFGRRMDTPVKTVKIHVNHICGKLQASRRVRVVEMARVAGLL